MLRSSQQATHSPLPAQMFILSESVALRKPKRILTAAGRKVILWFGTNLRRAATLARGLFG